MSGGVWFAVVPIWVAAVVVIWPSFRFYLEGSRLYKQEQWWEAADMFHRASARNVSASGLMLLSFIIILLAR